MGRAARARAAQRVIAGDRVRLVLDDLEVREPAPVAKNERPSDKLARQADQLRQLESELGDSIRAARAAGLSWDEISRATQLNRETLRRRYGRENGS